MIVHPHAVGVFHSAHDVIDAGHMVASADHHLSPLPPPPQTTTTRNPSVVTVAAATSYFLPLLPLRLPLPRFIQRENVDASAATCHQTSIH